MQRFRQLYRQIPSFLKNKYTLTFLVFLAWMLFFDQHNLFYQLEMQMKLDDLQDREVFYDRQIKEIKASKQELLHNRDKLERMARERYWMKRDDEDLYIVVDQ